MMKSRNKRHSTTSTVILHTALFFVLCSLPLQGADLSPDLRATVDQLKADVERSPTDRSNAASRMAVLWRWANAVSLAGGFVPKNLPLAAYFVPNPTPGTQLGRRYLEAIDLYVRQLAMLEQDSGALGTVRVDPEVEAIALSWQTISVRFEVGSRGIDDGGGFLISRHVMGGYPPLQVNDPAGDNFVSIATDRTGISFTVDEASVWGPYGGFRAPRPFPVYRVRGGRLRPGDRVTLTYGDRSGGGRGVRVGSFSNTAIALPLHLDPGDGRFYEMPPATYRVIGGRATRVHGFAPSIVAVGEPFEISVRSEDRYYNRATSELPDELPGYEVLLNGRRFGSLEAGRAIHALPVTLEREGVYRFTFRSLDGPEAARRAKGRRAGDRYAADPNHRADQEW